MAMLSVIIELRFMQADFRARKARMKYDEEQARIKRKSKSKT